MTALTDQIRRYAEAVEDPAAIGPDPRELSVEDDRLTTPGRVLADYPEAEERRRPTRLGRVAVAVAVVVVLVAASALLLIDRDRDGTDVATAPPAERLYPLPPADATNLQVGGSPEAGVGYYYDNPAGGRVVVHAYDWDAFPQGGEGLRPDLASTAPIEIDRFGQGHLGCFGAASDPSGVGPGYLYLELDRLSVQITLGRDPGGACTPGDDAAELVALAQGLRLVDRASWVDFVDERAPRYTEPPSAQIEIRLLAEGGPAGTPARPVPGRVTFTGTGGVSVTTGPDGTASIPVPAGSYTVEGFSPELNDGRLVCRPAGGTLTVVADVSQSLDVICPLK